MAHLSRPYRNEQERMHVSVPLAKYRCGAKINCTIDVRGNGDTLKQFCCRFVAHRSIQVAVIGAIGLNSCATCDTKTRPTSTVCPLVTLWRMWRLSLKHDRRIKALAGFDFKSHFAIIRADDAEDGMVTRAWHGEGDVDISSNGGSILGFRGCPLFKACPSNDPLIPMRVRILYSTVTPCFVNNNKELSPHALKSGHPTTCRPRDYRGRPKLPKYINWVLYLHYCRV